MIDVVFDFDQSETDSQPKNSNDNTLNEQRCFAIRASLILVESRRDDNTIIQVCACVHVLVLIQQLFLNRSYYIAT